jgi:hypothetical protein
MSDKSILWLLLRAHAECASQKHGEMYVFDNIPASNCYEQAQTFIEDAIRQLGFADRYIARQGDRKK